MKYPKISKAQAIGDTTLLVDFENQEKREYNIAKLLEMDMFAPLKNTNFFKMFTVDPNGYAVIWNEDIDISEFELWKNGKLPH